MTSTLGVLDLGDLASGDLVSSDLDSAATGFRWTVRVDDSAMDVSAPAVYDAQELPVEDSEATEKRKQFPVASDDVTGAITSQKVGSAKLNRTTIDEGG